MKDSLFEMLLNLFEKSLSQLQKNHRSTEGSSSEYSSEEGHAEDDEQSIYVKSAHSTSTRVLTYEEQIKMTKASYQFLMKLKLLTVIDTEVFETIMHQLQFSESRIVTLEETKWTIRNVMATDLTEKQLTFLDLVLYRAEDALTSH